MRRTFCRHTFPLTLILSLQGRGYFSPQGNACSFRENDINSQALGTSRFVAYPHRPREDRSANPQAAGHPFRDQMVFGLFASGQLGIIQNVARDVYISEIMKER